MRPVCHRLQRNSSVLLPNELLLHVTTCWTDSVIKPSNRRGLIKKYKFYFFSIFTKACLPKFLLTKYNTFSSTWTDGKKKKITQNSLKKRLSPENGKQDKKDRTQQTDVKLCHSKELTKMANKTPKTSSPSASYQISQIPPKAAVLQHNVQKHQCVSPTNNKP